MSKLKKIIIFMVLFSLGFSNAFSFSSPYPRKTEMMVGIKGGLNLSKFFGENSNFVTLFDNSEVYPDFKTGINIGLFFEYFLIENELSLETGLYYYQAGADYSHNGSMETIAMIEGAPVEVTVYNDFELEFSLEYLSAPVLIKYYFPLGKGLNFNINFGAQARQFLEATMTGHEYEYLDRDKFPDLDRRNEWNIDEELGAEDISSFDLALTGGFGINWNIGRGRLILEGNYDLGMMDILKDDKNFEMKNSGFMLRLGAGIFLD